jgi:hypothetical protein
MAVCDYCGLEAEVIVANDTKHTYTYPELECRFLQEQASKPGGFMSGDRFLVFTPRSSLGAVPSLR